MDSGIEVRAESWNLVGESIVRMIFLSLRGKYNLNYIKAYFKVNLWRLVNAYFYLHLNIIKHHMYKII